MPIGVTNMAKANLKMSTSTYPDGQAQAIEKKKQEARVLADQKAISDQHAIATQTTEDSATNAVLAEAMEIGEELSTHPEFVKALETAIQAKADDEYKAIDCLEWMEKFIPPNKLDRLPYPGITKAEAEVEWNKLLPSERPNIVIFDKAVASGGRSGTESYYKTLVQSLPPGKANILIRQNIEKERAAATVHPEQARDEMEIQAEYDRTTKSDNQVLSALRTAAKLRIQIQKIKKLENIEFHWVRDAYHGKETPPKKGTYDGTQMSVPGLGRIAHSGKVIWLQNSSAPSSKPIWITVNQFIRYRISDGMIAKKYATLGGTGGLVESSRTKKEPTTPTVSKAGDVHNWKELIENLNGIVSYETGDKTKETERYNEWKRGMTSADDNLVSLLILERLASAVLNEPGVREKATTAYNASKGL